MLSSPCSSLYATLLHYTTLFRSRLVVIDFAGGRLAKLADEAKPQVDAAASHGTLSNPVAYRNAATGGWRMSFELESGGARVSELRARLVDAQGPLSETWLYRWMA